MQLVPENARSGRGGLPIDVPPLRNQATHPDEPTALPAYQKPIIRVMDEKEVLSAFQVTVAAITWWVM